MKLCILVGYKFLIKNLNFGVNRCISGHVILQNIKFIRLAISQPFLKIETSGWTKKFYEIMRRTLQYSWGHQVHFWSRDCALTNFFIEKCQYL